MPLRTDSRSCRGFLNGVLGAGGGVLLAAAGALPALEPAKGQLAVSGAEQPELAPFDELPSRFVREQQVPGAQLAIAGDGRLVYARGFGLADRDSQRAVAPTAPRFAGLP